MKAKSKLEVFIRFPNTSSETGNFCIHSNSYPKGHKGKN